MHSAHIRPIAIAIIRRGDEILVFRDHDRARGFDYHRPLGGGIEFGEFAADALIREFMEELGEPLCDVRPLTLLENIFVLDDQPRHELVFLYEASFADASAYHRSSMQIIDDPEVAVLWVPVSHFRSNELILYPRGILDFI